MTQDVRICRGDQSRKLDTCLIRYTIKNEDTRQHKIGFRFLLDTYIGSNDGVPFTIPGRPGLCNTCYMGRGVEQIPDYLQVLERPDLKDPGTVAHLGLRLSDPDTKLDLPTQVMVTHWPGISAGWVISIAPIGRDSAVVIHWGERWYRAGETRQMGFSYGLGAVASSEGGGSLALTVGGVFRVGGEFTVVAYVKEPKQGQTVTLKLPPELKLIAPAKAKQEVLASMLHPITQVSWRVKAQKDGLFKIAAELDNGATQTKDVLIHLAK